MPVLTVIIPTFRRLEGLHLATMSVFAQTGIDAFNLIIVDNDPDGGARQTAERLHVAAPPHVHLRYVHEPDAGVANARNAAVDAADTPLIAFLDDDMTAPPDWLAGLLACRARFPAAVTFGPVSAVLPEGVIAHADYLRRFFSRLSLAPTGFTTQSWGCGNSLVDLQRLPPQRPVFDASTNETGGEDDMLFARVRRAGGQFAWCAEAPTFEHVPVSRATLTYTLRRAMSYGRGPVTMARKATPPNWFAVGGWMIVGACKFVVNGAIYAVKFLRRAPDRAEYLDRAARGFGKIFWWQDLRFYGASRLSPAPETARADD
jgi:succinoglycan biosynthesis protein ExoM